MRDEMDVAAVTLLCESILFISAVVCRHFLLIMGTRLRTACLIANWGQYRFTYLNYKYGEEANVSKQY